MKKAIVAGLFFMLGCSIFSSPVFAASYSYSWTLQSTSETPFNVIAALSQSAAFAAGESKAVGLTRYGKTLSSTPEVTTRYDINFYSTTKGVLTGASSKVDKITFTPAAPSEGQFSYVSFTPAFSATLATASVEGCLFNADGTGWVAGVDTSNGNGFIYKWTGAAFASQLSVASTTFNKIGFSDPNKGFAVGTKSSNKTVYLTTDGGTTWTDNTPVGAGVGSFNAVSVTSTNDVWVAGDGGLIFHWDGAAWSDKGLPSGTLGADTTKLFAVRFISATEGWASGDSGKVYHTINGGTTWSAESAFDASQSYRSITFAGANNGWIVGRTDSAGQIYRLVATPKINTVTPATITASTDAFTTIITAEGERFLGTVNSTTDVSAVAFTRGGVSVSSEVNILQRTSISGQKIELTANIFGTAGGQYDLTLVNQDNGFTSEANVLKIVPATLLLNNVRIDGITVESGAVTTNARAAKGPTVAAQILAPGALTGLTITGEVTIGATRDALAAGQFTISGEAASLESYQFSATLEAGTYAGKLIVHADNLSASQSFTLTVEAPVIAPGQQYPIVNPVVGNVVLQPGENLVIQFNTTLSQAELAGAKLVVIPSSPYDIYSADVASVRFRDGVRAFAGGAHFAEIKVKVPDELSRGVYSAYLKNASRLSPMIRFVIAKEK